MNFGLLLSLVVSSATPAAPAAPAAKPAAKAPAGPKELHTSVGGSVTVTTVKAPGGTFAFSVSGCTKAKADAPGECAVNVALNGNTQKLEWTAPTGAIVLQGDTGFVVGDDADTAQLVTFRVVTVGKGVSGIIVTQQQGAERVKRRHDVFLARGGRMDYAFTAREPRGDKTWSAVTPLDLDKDGGSELVLLQAATPDEEAADTWSVSVWGYRADIGKIVKMPSWRPTLHAALVGIYQTAAEAREQKKSSKCLREFVVVDEKSYTRLQPGQFALAFLGTTHGEADLALEAAKACDDSIVGSLQVASPGMNVDD